MNRFQKKCLYASAAGHGLLLLLLLIGPAFFQDRSRTEPLPVMTFVPAQVVDAALSPPPAAAPAPTPIPSPPPPQPAPEPLPRRIEPPPQPRPQPAPQPVAPAPDRPAPRVQQPPPAPPRRTPSTDRVTRTTPSPRATADAQAQTQARTQSQLRDLRQTLSDSSGIELPSVRGDVGSDYRQIVRSKYHHNWTPPPDLADESATVVVKVVIRRNGDVVNAEVVRKSGHAELDRSVQRALSLRHIAPFPPATQIPQQEFEIHFNLKAKRSL